MQESESTSYEEYDDEEIEIAIVAKAKEITQQTLLNSIEQGYAQQFAI